MTANGDRPDEALTGEAAPPTANGELVFDAPWEGRAFGMARALCERGYFDWDEFRAELIDQISAWEASPECTEEYRYYDLFLAALTRIIEQKSLCQGPDLVMRELEFAARPHGHDH
ncbi:MAG: nitrile hydratase accessory protein [Pseudomonadales bacterium]